MLSINNIKILGRTYRHFHRYRQILRVLLHHGFDELADSFHLNPYQKIKAKFFRRTLRPNLEQSKQAERVRKVLEELGPTFVKLGQILSTRPDLIPLKYIDELSKLRDKVSPFSYEHVKTIVWEETGKYPQEVFAEFEESPYAAASIGQVHLARLRSGERVVVKIQRPHILKIIDTDLEILSYMASFLESQLKEFEIHRPTGIIEEFARSLEKELDYRMEASQIDRFKEEFKEDPTIYVPKYFSEFTTRRMLTMEFVDGIECSDFDSLIREKYNLKLLANRGANLIMKQIFLHGFFHADPHPGNIFILPENVICFVDFGMMGRVTGHDQRILANIAIHIIQKDVRRAMEALLQLTEYQEEPNKAQLERDLCDLIDGHLYRPLKQLEFGLVLRKLIEIATRNRLTLRPELFVIMKVIGQIESLGHKLDPDFELISHAEKTITKLSLRRIHPKQISHDAIDSGTELYHLLKDIPGELRKILKKAGKGEAKIQFEHCGLGAMQQTLLRISNQLSFALVLASLIVGSSLIILSGIPPKWQEIPIIGVVGYGIAGLMGFWLMISILKRGMS